MLLPLVTAAQVNTERVMLMGRNALYYDDYVLSIQYFNEVINAKPFLYDPYYFRAIAKFYLGDWQGAEADCSKAIDLNPFIEDSYQLRGLCRIKQENYQGAVDDYSIVIKYKSLDQASWYNRLLCRIHLKDYDNAKKDIAAIHTKWPQYTKAYELEAQVCIMTKDTLRADSLYQLVTEKDKENGEAWGARAIIALSKGNLEKADTLLDRAIKYSPDIVDFYVDKALLAFKFNRLRDAMSNYDKALELDPQNFPAHYNRGLLRTEVGEDNKAIEDFDFVLGLEPDNLLALFNRAVLYEKTGNYKGAIKDVTRVIQQYPHFWTGYALRARCRRKTGNAKGAADDERKLMIAELDRTFNHKRYANKSTRNRREANIEDYQKIVVDDDTAGITKYAEEYRGKVQYRNVEAQAKPIFSFSASSPRISAIGNKTYYWKGLDKWNKKHDVQKPLRITNEPGYTDEGTLKQYSADIATLSSRSDSLQESNLFLRAVMYCDVKDYSSALSCMEKCIEKDTTSAILYFQIAALKQYTLGFMTNASEGEKVHGETLFTLHSIRDDLKKAHKLMPDNEFICYNLACNYMNENDNNNAEAQFSMALRINPRLAEAYYNRALVRMKLGEKVKAAADLSRAGELGLYDAYSILRQNRLK